MSPADAAAMVKDSTVLGRGGAGFPAGVKWGLTPQAVWPRYLVVNGDESEPGTYKDRLLMERDPHQLIEGCLIACYAAGLSRCFLYIRGEMALAQERVATALNEAYAAGYIGKNILGSEMSVDIVLHWGAGAYVVGEETALIESLEGNRGMPRLKPPYFPAAVGLYGKPTIVNNVETLSNLPWLLTNGTAAYTAIGTPTSPGTRMVAVSGHVKRPGVFEIINGTTTFRDLIYGEEFCQGIRDGPRAQGVRARRRVGAVVHRRPARHPVRGPARRRGRLDARLRRGDGDGRDHRHPLRGADPVPVLRPRVVRQVHAVPRGRHVADAHPASGSATATAPTADLDQLFAVGETICPGAFPHAASEKLGIEAVPFPYKMTTICFVGPSAYAPVHSALMLFRDEFEAKVTTSTKRVTIPVMADQPGSRGRTVTDVKPADGDAVEDAPPPNPNDVHLTINGKAVVAQKGELIIKAADDNGEYIPRFCYHNRMEPVGMCRMCICEVDSGRGPQLVPTCMVTVAEGMKVETESPMSKQVQEGIIELLLANHPLDCPVCDKGGECPLQDQSFSHGPGESRYVEEKRHYEKPIPISDLVYLDRERCILCDRCTRFADEVAGDALIHFTHRGNSTQINTFPDEPFSSYFSGNTVQICPVGALTAKPYRFKARPWDLGEIESTCTGCATGCRIVVQSTRDEVVRYLGVDSEPVNWGWLCDKGRFGYEATNSPDRVVEPLVRTGDALAGAPLAATSWNVALHEAARADRGGQDRRRADEHRRARRGARHQRGRLRLGQAGQRGHRHAERATASSATDCRRPSSTCHGRPSPRRRWPRRSCCSGRTSRRSSVRCTCASATRPRAASGKIIELTPKRSGLSPLAWRSVGYEPGTQVAAMSQLLADPTVAAQLAAGPVVVIVGRANLAETAGPHDRRARRAALTRARRRRCCRRSAGATWSARCRSACSPARAARTCSASCRTPPRGASSCSCCSAPIRSATSPTATSPGGRSPTCRASSRSTRSSTRPASSPRWCCRRRLPARSAARTRTSRVASRRSTRRSRRAAPRTRTG